MEENRLLKDNLPSLFIGYVLPAVIAMVLSGIQGMIDGIFLGNYAGSNVMASVNIANPFLQISIGGAMVVCTGTLSHLGRVIGEKNLKKAQDVFKSSVIGAAVISVFLLLSGILFHKQIALLLGATEVLLSDTARYIQIIAAFIPAISFMLIFGFVNRLVGKPRLYLYATVACVMMNIILDFLTIKLLKMGVTGAAFATGISYLIGFLIVMKPSLSRQTTVNVFSGKYHSKLFIKTIQNGSSEGITSISAALTMFLFNLAFIHYAGEDGVAAFSVINYIGNFVTLVMFGVSDGIVSIVSCNYGAGNIKRIQKTFYSAVIINFVIGLLCLGVLVFGSENLIAVFLKGNQEVLRIACLGAEIYALGFLFAGFNILQSGYHTAVGNALVSFLISASRGIICIFIGVLVLPRFMEINGVWATVPLAEAVTIVLCGILMMKNRKLFFCDEKNMNK